MRRCILFSHGIEILSLISHDTNSTLSRPNLSFSIWILLGAQNTYTEEFYTYWYILHITVLSLGHWTHFKPNKWDVAAVKVQINISGVVV